MSDPVPPVTGPGWAPPEPDQAVEELPVPGQVWFRNRVTRTVIVAALAGVVVYVTGFLWRAGLLGVLAGVPTRPWAGLVGAVLVGTGPGLVGVAAGWWWSSRTEPGHSRVAVRALTAGLVLTGVAVACWSGTSLRVDPAGALPGPVTDVVDAFGVRAGSYQHGTKWGLAGSLVATVAVFVMVGVGGLLRRRAARRDEPFTLDVPWRTAVFAFGTVVLFTAVSVPEQIPYTSLSVNPDTTVAGFNVANIDNKAGCPSVPFPAELTRGCVSAVRATLQTDSSETVLWVFRYAGYTWSKHAYLSTVDQWVQNTAHQADGQVWSWVWDVDGFRVLAAVGTDPDDVVSVTRNAGAFAGGWDQP